MTPQKPSKKPSLLDELTDGWKPSPPAVQRRTLQRWLDTQKRLEKARRDVVTEEQRLKDACAAMVRTFGRQPIVVNGETYDPAHSTKKDGTRFIYYIKRLRLKTL